jgi:hypothetical protein
MLRSPTLRRAFTASQHPQIYHGPLTTTFRRLKLFSLSSLGLSVGLAPFLFLLETSSGLPVIARFALAGTALTTSGVSTALVGWCGKPYVTTLEREGGGVAMTTLTLALKKRVTHVYDTAFLVDTSRPFAKWELAESVHVDGKSRDTVPGTEETVAETLDSRGAVVGRWIVKWGEGGQGTCREVGKISRCAFYHSYSSLELTVGRHFNVHEELLPTPIR